jgi:glycerol uptake facilitator-like aquaporin
MSDISPTEALGAPCYDAFVFNFGKPKTVGDWIVQIAGAMIAIFLVWWMLRLYVL